MSKKQAIILFFTTIFVAILALKPLNYFCRATEMCEPIILSHYLPQKTGKRNFEIILETKNSLTATNFNPTTHSKIIKTGKTTKITFKIQNNTKKTLSLRPKPYFVPVEAEKYIEIQNCLCQEEKTVKPSATKIVKINFKINPKIEQDKFFDKISQIKIGYEI